MSATVDRIKELVWGEGNWVKLGSVEDGHLVYDVLNKQNASLLEFRVPPADQLGATFHLTDTPKVFMRWIRKEIEKQVAEAAHVEEARKLWAEELAKKEGTSE